MVDVISYPLDTVKTRLQTPNKFRTPTNDMTGLSIKDSVKGISTNIISFPCGFIYFLVYDKFNRYFERLSDKYAHSSLCHLLAGTAAEVASITIRNPLEVIKQQLQVGLDTKFSEAVKHVYQLRGLKGNRLLTERILFRILQFHHARRSIFCDPDADL